MTMGKSAYTETVRDAGQRPVDEPVPVVEVGRGGQVANRYRDIMSRWPTGIAVVTATDLSGTRCGMTCNSLCSVSVEPPSLLVSLHVKAQATAAIRDTRLFCINFLRAGSRSVSQSFASHISDRFEGIAWKNSPTVGQPWLVEDACALVECRLSSLTAVHDHFLLVGDVLGVQRSDTDPLLYYNRQYTSVRL